MSPTTQSCPDGQLRVSLRECRVIVERLLLVAGAPRGTLAAAVDLVVSTQAVRGDALQTLAREIDDGSLDLLPPHEAGAVDGWPVLDARGGSTLLVADMALDRATAAQRDGWGLAAVVDVRHAVFAAGLAPVAARRGRAVLAVGVDAEGTVELLPETTAGPGAPDLHALAENVSSAYPHAHGCIVVATRPEPEPERRVRLSQLVGDRWTAAVVTRQLCVDEPLWWSLYERSARALTPASDASRLDTGIVHDPTAEAGSVDAY
jgi:hypothetical protein